MSGIDSVVRLAWFQPHTLSFLGSVCPSLFSSGQRTGGYTPPLSAALSRTVRPLCPDTLSATQVVFPFKPMRPPSKGMNSCL